MEFHEAAESVRLQLDHGWYDSPKHMVAIWSHVDERFSHVVAIEKNGGGMAEGMKRGIANHAVLDALAYMKVDCKSLQRLPGKSGEPPLPSHENHFLVDRKDGRKNALMDCVYFIQADCGGPIKIGKASSVYARVESLQVGCPFPLVILAVIEGCDSGQEARLHRRFAADRLHGEWFEASRDLLDYIGSLGAEATA